MDYVFVNAQVTIGLLQATLEQRHLDALGIYFESEFGLGMCRRDPSESMFSYGMRHRGPNPLRWCTSLRFESLAEALSMVAMDRWNTRAWILQEAFVSAGNMILLLPRAKEIIIKGWSLICHDLSLTEIGIKLEWLHWCIAKFSPRSNYHIKLPQRAENLERLIWFHPEPSGFHKVRFWFGSTKPRHTCNAAVALSFLKHRDNDRVADRLAIIANLCDYSLRLNTWELEKTQSRLSVCVLALTIANGDLSLLSPDSYLIPRGLHISMFVQMAVTDRNTAFLTGNSPG